MSAWLPEVGIDHGRIGAYLGGRVPSAIFFAIVSTQDFVGRPMIMSILCSKHTVSPLLTIFDQFG
jgi:hypothetical protein